MKGRIGDLQREKKIIMISLAICNIVKNFQITKLSKSYSLKHFAFSQGFINIFLIKSCHPFYLSLLSYRFIHPQKNMYAHIRWIRSLQHVYRIKHRLEIPFFVFKLWLFSYILPTYFCIWTGCKLSSFYSISRNCTNAKLGLLVFVLTLNLCF